MHQLMWNKDFDEIKISWFHTSLDRITSSVVSVDIWIVLQDKNMSFPLNPNSNIYSKHLYRSFDYPVFGKTRFSHFIYQYFFDENYPEKYPISLMLSGNYYIIKEIESNYDEIIMENLIIMFN